MAISIPGRTVVFDYGEVISFSPSEHDRAAILSTAGIGSADGAAFWAAYWRHRDALDRGTIGPTAYWATVAADLGTTWDPATVQRLWVADFRSWTSVDPAVFDLVAQLRDGGTRTALLSNAGADYGSAFRHSPLGELIGPVFVSGELDLVKPDPAIYVATAAALEVEIASIAFIDNKRENVDGAIAAGVGDAHHFTGVDGLRAFLAALAG